MIFEETSLAKCYVITPKLLQDERGGFARVFCEELFQQIGLTKKFVQINHSYNNLKGTIRGMHFQIPPFSEYKLIRCVKGAVIDVVVDIRKNTPTFLKHYAVELSAENKKMILVPEGFAHGFQTLKDDSELIYHHTEFYVPNSEGGLRFNDERLNIKWPLPVTSISERDKYHNLIDNNFKGI